MVNVPVDEHAAEKLRRAATVRGMDVAELLDEVIERYLADERLAQIDQEQQAYEAQHAQLLLTYPGHYIAMRQGKVVDHDADRSALGRRVCAQYGDDPVLITPVQPEARQTLVLRSPRLARTRP